MKIQNNSNFIIKIIDHLKNIEILKYHIRKGKLFLPIFLAIGLIISGCNKKDDIELQEDDLQLQENDLQDREFFEDCTQGAEITEIILDGEKVLCFEVDGRYIVEGDIILGDIATFNSLEESDTATMTTRAAVGNGINLWPEGKVYYYYNPAFLEYTTESAIKTAMNIIEVSTNVKFIPLRTPEARQTKKNYVVFEQEKYNLSALGMKNSPQYIFLRKDNPAALHEIGHTLGLQHEHCRFDRDDHINIHRENIVGNNNFFEANFRKNPLSPLYTKTFDLESIMMYDSYYNSKNGRPTMTKKYNEKAPTFRPQRFKLTDGDQSVINKMYERPSVITPDFFIHSNNIQPTTNSCELTGELIYTGSPAITEYGFGYREYNSNSVNYERVRSTDNYGRYKCILTNLKPNTTYIAAAYIKQNGQIFASEAIQFTTKPATTAQVRFRKKYNHPDLTFGVGRNCYQLTS